jgi:hypothetical protein
MNEDKKRLLQAVLHRMLGVQDKAEREREHERDLSSTRA